MCPGEEGNIAFNRHPAAGTQKRDEATGKKKSGGGGGRLGKVRGYLIASEPQHCGVSLTEELIHRDQGRGAKWRGRTSRPGGLT